jgi:hypothetical protein
MKKKATFTKFIILAVMAMLPCFWNKVSALAIHDCDTITWNIALFKNAVFGEKTIKFENVFPDDALTRAIKNLTAYCCEDILKQWEKPDERCSDPSLPKSNYPESPYLFDHLIDVGFRRLEWINNYSDVQVDPTGYARRNAIKEIATNPSIVAPSEIVKIYTGYRSLAPKRMFKKIHLNMENMNATEAGLVGQYINTYDTQVSLADKYNNLCRIARNIYERKPWKLISLWGDKIEKGRSYYSACQKIAANKISQENMYVKAILIKKAADMIADNFDTTLDKQFVQWNLSKLQSTIAKIKDLFQILVRQAPYCKKCSQ